MAPVPTALAVRMQAKLQQVKYITVRQQGAGEQWDWCSPPSASCGVLKKGATWNERMHPQHHGTNNTEASTGIESLMSKLHCAHTDRLPFAAEATMRRRTRQGKLRQRQNRHLTRVDIGVEQPSREQREGSGTAVYTITAHVHFPTVARPCRIGCRRCS
jgi:hypothetical protein